MTPDRIQSWAALGESETQEFKRTTGERREAIRTLCAMLNNRGGRVLFGVEPDGRVTGQHVSDHTLEEVAQEIREIDPPAFPSMERVPLESGREVLVVSVSGGQTNLIVVADRPISVSAIPIPSCRGTSITACFWHRPHRGSWFTGTGDHTARLGASEAGCAFQQSQRFLLDHMPIAGRFEPNRMERIDEPAYSPLAFREAIANAICHRDYASGGSSIGVAIYDDRLEVTSSGTLHFGITPQSLFQPHESRPWNPLIAGLFYRRGIIETWGQGTIKMVAWAEEAGLPKPEILEIPGAVLVRFQRRTSGAPSVASEKTPGETLGKTTGKTTGKTLEKTTGKTAAAVWQLLAEDGTLSVLQISKQLKKSELTIHRAIRKLRESGRLERVGPDKGGHWKVIR